MKGKALYAKCREFIDNFDPDETDEEKSQEVIEEAAELGMSLVVDVAESLNKIATKIG
jgi:hypothetical protein